MILRVMVSRHAAFYSPLISTLAAGFLDRRGIQATYSVLGAGQRSQTLIREGAVDVMQSAVASNWKPMARGDSPLPVHFAQINARDGFFLVGRSPSFSWTDLHGRGLLADHGLQPITMLRYAAHSNEVDWSGVHIVNAGSPEEMAAAFRSGAGDYVHLQGPAAQQLERDGAGHVVASVGEAMPPVAFSSLCCSREFLGTREFRAFLEAFAEAKEWVRTGPAEVIAEREAPFFPGMDTLVLAGTIRRYQALGCWDGGVEIPRALYEQALNVFEHAGEIHERFPYESVCVQVQAGPAADG